MNNSFSLRRLSLTLLLPTALLACSTPQEDTGNSTTTPAGTSAASTDHSEHTGSEHMSTSGETTMPNPDTSGTSTATQTEPLPLEVSDARVTAVPESVRETAAYFTLKNNSDEDIKLVWASSPAAGHSILMTHSSTQSGNNAAMSGMVEVPSLTVPAHGELTLAPGGDHVMLMDLLNPIKEGDRIVITLEDEGGRRVTVDAEVKRL